MSTIRAKRTYDSPTIMVAGNVVAKTEGGLTKLPIEPVDGSFARNE